MNTEESPYATPGGNCCMYCGTAHSSALECRSPCDETGCTWKGVKYEGQEKRGGTVIRSWTFGPKCIRHAPRDRPWESTIFTPLPADPPQPTT